MQSLNAEVPSNFWDILSWLFKIEGFVFYVNWELYANMLYDFDSVWEIMYHPFGKGFYKYEIGW